jgi:hypothetical protein
VRRDRHLVRGASAIGRDRLTTEERLSDIVEILAHGLLWLDVLRDFHGSILGRPHPERRETSRPPGAGSDEIRNRAQHQDCQSTRLGSTAECVCPSRRGDRMKLLLHLLTFARRQARRPSGLAADQVRAGDQPQDRQCDGHYSSPDISGTRRQGDMGEPLEPRPPELPRSLLGVLG